MAIWCANAPAPRSSTSKVTGTAYRLIQLNASSVCMGYESRVDDTAANEAKQRFLWERGLRRGCETSGRRAGGRGGSASASGRGERRRSSRTLNYLPSPSQSPEPTHSQPSDPLRMRNN